MTQTAHTPGPWAFTADDDAIVYDPATQRGIAYTWGEDLPYVQSDAERFANARLIAAAPDTKTALEDMIDLVIWMSGAADFAPEGKAHKGWLNAQKRITAANAAIASATGEA